MGLMASGLSRISGMNVCHLRHVYRKPAPRQRGRNWDGKPFSQDEKTMVVELVRRSCFVLEYISSGTCAYAHDQWQSRTCSCTVL